MANLYRRPNALPNFWARPDAHPDVAEPAALPAASRAAMPVYAEPAAPRVDLSFLRAPLRGGNIFKTLGLALGGAALAKNPGETLGAALGGLNAYRGARQQRAQAAYERAVSAFRTQEDIRRHDEEMAFRAQQAQAADAYRDRTLAETERSHRAGETRAEQDRNARLGTTLLNAIGPNDPRTVDALRAGGMGFLPPPGSSPMGFVPAADGAPTAWDAPVSYDPGSLFGSRAANTAATQARTLGTLLDNTFKDRTMEPRVQHQVMIPRLDEANLAGIKTRTAAAAGAEGRARALHPGKVEQQKLENEMLRTGRIPMAQEQLRGQQIRNRFLPGMLAADLEGTQARTDATRLGTQARLDGAVNVPTGANAAIARNAAGMVGQDFGQRGCARFVTQTLQDAGVSLRGSENAGELERQIRNVGGVRVESNPANFKPGDILFMPGSGPSGRHVMVVDSQGRILGNPGTSKQTRVQVQQGGRGMVAYRLPEGTIKGQPPKAAAPKPAPKPDDPWKGVPSSFRSTALNIGLSPFVPPDAAQAFIEEWKEKRGVQRDFRGNLVESSNARTRDAMRAARRELNSRYARGTATAAQTIPTGGEDAEVAAILDSLR